MFSLIVMPIPLEIQRIALLESLRLLVLGVLPLFLLFLEYRFKSRSLTRYYSSWVDNFLMVAFVPLVLFLPLKNAVLFAFDLADSGAGLFNSIVKLPLPFSFLLGILLLDFVTWFMHWLGHKIPLLWRFHQIHHNDEILDASTTLRVHPGEYVYQASAKFLLIYAFGISPVCIVVYSYLFILFAAASHISIKYPRIVDKLIGWFIVTPYIHSIHHATHGNYGNVLSIWDILFRTFRSGLTDKQIEYGIRAQGNQNKGYRFYHLFMLPFLRSRRSQPG